MYSPRPVSGSMLLSKLTCLATEALTWGSWFLIGIGLLELCVLVIVWDQIQVYLQKPLHPTSGKPVN